MAQDREFGKAGRRRAHRGGGFRQASDRARPALDKVAGRHGFAELDVLLHWPEIIGEALAPICRPIRVRYGSARKLGATLVVQTNGARAPEVEHLSPRIIERVNQFYGYRAVSRLQIVQAGTIGLAEKQAGFKGPDHVPDAADTRRAEALTAGVDDEDLRAALNRLGANVLARTRRRSPDKIQ